MTQSELQRYLDESIRNYSIGPLYVPRRFTALPESGSVSSDLEFRAYGMLREREPALKEILTHPAIAIVADPGAGKSVVGRASVQHLIANGGRVPVFAELKQYRVDLPTLFRITTPTAILDPAAMVEGVPLRRTYVLDGIDEIPAELVQRLGTELREFIAHESQAHFVFTARQLFMSPTEICYRRFRRYSTFCPSQQRTSRSTAPRPALIPTVSWMQFTL